MLLIIAVGIAIGLVFARPEMKGWDHYIMFYLIPVMLLQTGLQANVNWENLRLMAVMAGEVCVTFFLARLLANRLFIDTNARNGFLVLAVCGNTGHGLMLLKSFTSDPEVLRLSSTAAYVGFLVVIVLPQILTAGSRSALRQMPAAILWHPVSYSTIAGFLTTLQPLFGAAWLLLVGARIAWAKRNRMTVLNDNGTVWLVLAGVWVFLMATHGSWFYDTSMVYWPKVVTFVTTITIGAKMRLFPIQRKDWVVVVAIVAFGLVIKPAVALLLGQLVGVSKAEAFVLAYMLAQPPAYLGIMWLRGNKFGELSVSEWTFTVQAVGAYALAEIIPKLLQVWW